MNTASGRAWVGISGVLAAFFLFFYWRFFLARTSTHSSSMLAAFGLFSTGFCAAAASRLTVGSLSRLRVSRVDLGAGYGRVSLPSSTTPLFLWDLISLIFWTILPLGRYLQSLIGRLMFFLVLEKLSIFLRATSTAKDWPWYHAALSTVKNTLNWGYSFGSIRGTLFATPHLVFFSFKEGRNALCTFKEASFPPGV